MTVTETIIIIVLIGIVLFFTIFPFIDLPASKKSAEREDDETPEHDETATLKRHIEVLELLYKMENITNEQRAAISASIDALEDDIGEMSPDQSELENLTSQTRNTSPDTGKPRKNLFRRSKNPISPWEL